MLFTSPRYASSLISGQQAVTGSAVALPDVPVAEWILKADSDNAIPVYVGPSGITTSTGFKLLPGDWISPDSSNLKELYVIAATTGATVSWIGKKF